MPRGRERFVLGKRGSDEAACLGDVVRAIRLLLVLIVPLMVEPVIPVASNTTGDPVSPAAEALKLLGPGLAPRAQLVSVAMPLASLFMGVVGSMVPPPAVT